MKSIRAILLAVMSLHAMAAPKRYCGVERTPVKTLTDAAAADVEFNVKQITVAELRKLEAPKKIGNSLARLDSEKHAYEVQAWIIGYKFENGPEGDGDFHVVISTPGKPAETMIFEIPHPDCGRPEDAARFEELRTFIAGLGAKPSPKFYTLPKPVLVTLSGVPFFDKIHGQKGVAPNGVELHPGLKITK